MIKSTIKATLLSQSGVGDKINITIDDMDITGELAGQIMDKILEVFHSCKSYEDGKVKTADVEEYEFSQPNKDQQTIFDSKGFAQELANETGSEISTTQGKEKVVAFPRKNTSIPE